MDDDNSNTLGDMGDQVSKVQNEIEKMVQSMTKLVKTMTDGFSKGITVIREFADNSTGVSKILDNLNDVSMKVADSVDDVGVAFDKTSDSIDALQDPMDKLLVSATKLSSIMPVEKFSAFGQIAGAVINTTNANLDIMSKTLSALHMPDTLAAGLVGTAKNFISNAAEAEKFEGQFLSLTAAAGNMNSIFDQTGKLTKDLSSLTANYATSAEGAATATGMTVDQTLSFQNAMKGIPGILNQTISSGQATQDTYSALINSMRLMSGTGQSEKTVIDDLNTAYDNLSSSQGRVNDTAQKGAQLLALTSQVADALGVKFENVQDVMSGISKEFQFIGDNSEAAARVIGQFSDKLQQTGLTGKASLDIVKEMTNSISTMGVAQKAFLSARNGGPGGLQGAFQVEEMMRKGNFDQVLNMAQNAMKQQMGGKIYTQAEAAQSQEGASGFMRQRQLLQSGAFGIGKGMGDDKATRLLEAMAKGNTTDAVKEIKTGQDAVQRATSRGSEIQERNNNEFKRMNSSLDIIAMNATLQAGLQMKQTQGSMGGNLANMRASMKGGVDANMLAGERGKNIDTTRDDFMKETVLSGKQAIQGLLGSMSGIKSGIGSSIMGAGTSVGDAASAVGQMISQSGPRSGVASGGSNIQQHMFHPIMPIGSARDVANMATDKTSKDNGITNAVQKHSVEVMINASPLFEAQVKGKDVDITRSQNVKRAAGHGL